MCETTSLEWGGISSIVTQRISETTRSKFWHSPKIIFIYKKKYTTLIKDLQLDFWLPKPLTGDKPENGHKQDLKWE